MPEPYLTSLQTLSPLELLPTEIFVDILRRGTPASVLALKLTSRTILHMTKDGDGKEVINIHAVLESARDCERRLDEYEFKWLPVGSQNPAPTAAESEAYATDQENWPANAKVLEDYIAMRIRCEADTPRSLLTHLTCSGCGIAKTNGIEGFADCHFKPKRLDRFCLSCRPRFIDRMNVCGMKIFRCWLCQVIKYRHSRATETIAEAVMKRTAQYGHVAGESIATCYHDHACQSCTNEMVQLCSVPYSKELYEARRYLITTLKSAKRAQIQDTQGVDGSGDSRGLQIDSGHATGV